ncbi:MAG: hypothetical protein LBD27_04195 [Tannerella sp.]|jgi:mannose-6-phosphate isomerase-like protein (cupin superfamily)|nr:hypothetical protein [Tannerella sp.]
MKLIEEYIHEGTGYNPFFIRDGWQVAKLNALPGHGFEEIHRIEVHNSTDEIFVLITGTAVLIAAEVRTDEIRFQTIRMKPGVVYNIPAGVWHNIAMEKDAELVIVEKDNTHLHDCQYRKLTYDQWEELNDWVEHALKH